MVDLRVDDRLPLSAITPLALLSYVRSEGWEKIGVYRRYSDVYAGEGKPDIIVPRTDVIDDYEMVVSDLVSTFSKVLDRDEISVYRDLTVADRDVLRFRVVEADPSGLSFETGHDLIRGARDMLAAAAYSLGDSRRAYRSGTSGAAADYLNRVRLSHTEKGSFAIVLTSPTVAPRLGALMNDGEDEAAPKERMVAQRLSESLFATRSAAEAVVAGDAYAFEQAVEFGVSANLCEAVADLVESVSSFDISFSWAMTRPSSSSRGPVRFSYSDHPILKEAALSLRSQEPEYDKPISGFIYSLTSKQVDIDGIVTMRTSIDSVGRSVVAELSRQDYVRAIEAHKTNSIVYLKGDLERIGNRLRLRNAKLVDVIAPALQLQLDW